MAERVFKRYSCTEPVTDADGRPAGGVGEVRRRRQLGTGCPRLAGDGHGSWWYQVDLPRNLDGARRRLRRGGFASRQSASDAAEAVRELLAIPDVDDDDDEEARREVGELVRRCTRRGGEVPDHDELRDRYRCGKPLAPFPTVAEWLDHWLRGKKGIRPNTWHIYECHIRLYLKPYLGRIRLDRLRVDHIVDMFDGIDERNDLIRQRATPSTRTCALG